MIFAIVWCFSSHYRLKFPSCYSLHFAIHFFSYSTPITPQGLRGFWKGTPSPRGQRFSKPLGQTSTGAPWSAWLAHQDHHKCFLGGGNLFFLIFTPSWEITPWKINMEPIERKIIFPTSMIMFHVNLQGCNPIWLEHIFQIGWFNHQPVLYSFVLRDICHPQWN